MDENSIREKLNIEFHPRAKAKAWCSGKADSVDASEEDPHKKSPKKFRQVCQEDKTKKKSNKSGRGGGGLVQAGREPENTFRTAG